MNKRVDQFIMYGAYVKDWMDTHDEGCPVCFDEFIQNEYRDGDYMMYLSDEVIHSWRE